MWLATQPPSAEVDVLQHDGERLTVVAVMTNGKVVPVSKP